MGWTTPWARMLWAMLWSSSSSNTRLGWSGSSSMSARLKRSASPGAALLAARRLARVNSLNRARALSVTTGLGLRSTKGRKGEVSSIIMG